MKVEDRERETGGGGGGVENESNGACNEIVPGGTRMGEEGGGG